MYKELEKLYHAIDQITKRLEKIHKNRMQCTLGCTDCCVDNITVFKIEADNIRHYHSNLLQKEAPHAPGACAFLDGIGACRIYEQRPYVCRTQGLPLRWVEENTEYRDICPLNDEGRPVEDLPPEQCWTIGPFEKRLALLQNKRYNDRMERIALRSLFDSGK